MNGTKLESGQLIVHDDIFYEVIAVSKPESNLKNCCNCIITYENTNTGKLESRSYDNFCERFSGSSVWN